MKAISINKLAATLALLIAGVSNVTADNFQVHYKVNGLTKVPVVPETTYTSHTFTSCGHQGRFGPNLSQCLAAYQNEEILKPEYAFTVSGGIQKWTVPVTGTYRIEAFGAQGGSVGGYAGGYGARIQGEFTLEQGSVLDIMVGQTGTGAGRGAGGGGATLVVLAGQPLVIAGAGGGAVSYSGFNGGHASDTANGGNSNILSASYGGTAAPGAGGGAVGGYGGRNGYGGGGALAAGGTGWLGVGGTGAHQAYPGQRFTGGGVGGDSTNSSGYSYGGFGGGGAGSPNNGYGGGGGGYSGGGGGSFNGTQGGNGGGGGSLNTGANPSNTAAIHAGHGKVTISKL